ITKNPRALMNVLAKRSTRPAARGLFPWMQSGMTAARRKSHGRIIVQAFARPHACHAQEKNPPAYDTSDARKKRQEWLARARLFYRFGFQLAIRRRLWQASYPIDCGADALRACLALLDRRTADHDGITNGRSGAN